VAFVVRAGTGAGGREIISRVCWSLLSSWRMPCRNETSLEATGAPVSSFQPRRRASSLPWRESAYLGRVGAGMAIGGKGSTGPRDGIRGER